MNSLTRALARPLGIAAALLVVALSSPLFAQQAMHREVPRGEVTGLEMSIEGSLNYRPGEPFRWYVRLYEVVHRRDLRPAAHCILRATAPFAASAPLEVPTGEDGRALITLAVPSQEALELTAESFVVEATCPRGVRRVFDVALQQESAHAFTLVADRSAFTPGAPVFLMGRLVHSGSRRGIANVPVAIHGTSGGELRGNATVETDRAGFFTARIDMSQSTAQVVFTALATLNEHTTVSAVVTLAPAQAPVPQAMEVRATPDRIVAGPNEDVDFTVQVRTPEGTPIAGATVGELYANEEERPPVRTDAHGIAHVRWHSPAVLSAALEEGSVNFEVQSESHGRVTGYGRVRLARQSTFAAVIPRGGALVPGLPARVYVRVVDAAGAPRANEPVVVRGDAVGTDLRAVTDASGLAFVDVPSIAATQADSCGGTTSTELTIETHGTQIARCVPVDPDAPLLVVTPPRVDISGEIVMTLQRRPIAENETVLLTLLREGSEGWEPVSAIIAPAHATSANIRVPADVRGLLWVRARLLRAGGEDIRGASALTLLEDAPEAFSLRAEGTQLSTSRDAFVTFTSASHAATLRAQLDPMFDLRSLSTLALESTFAGRVPADVGASAMLREGQVVPQALPDQPLSVGLLRDPWRTRARFVRGRVGRLMMAVESIVERSIPSRLDEVGVRGPGGWTWNREMLDTAVDAAGIDDEGSAALDGEPLDIDALVTLDPTFTYDNVARRITRKRLWDVIVSMRAMAHERNLDLSWAHRGDPATWIASLAEDSGESDMLFDAWGHPFVMRRTTRTSFLPAVPGWEVASAGPDGVINTSDDVFDPFVRILPETSLYAEAVGENALIARLSSVALGRAFVFTLDEFMGGSVEYEEPSDVSATASSRAWEDLPAMFATEEELHVDERGPLSAQLSSESSFRPTIRSRERIWTAIAFTSTPSGALDSETRAVEAGARIVFSAHMPTVLRVGDHLDVPFVATTLREGTQVALSIAAEGTAVDAQLTNPSEGTEPSGHITLTAERPGAAMVMLRSADGTFSHAHRIRVLPQGIPLMSRRGGAARITELDVPTQPGRVLAQTLIVTTPRTLHRAQLLDAQNGANAAILAWAGTLQGDLDTALLPQATSVLAQPDSLTLACALVATATQEDLSTQTEALRSALGLHARGGDVRTRAATLLALASLPTAPDAGDPVANTIRASRLDGWRAVHVARADPNAMAMMAAALLTVNPEDETGRVLYETSLSAPQVVPASIGDARVDTWIATLARALAARHLGLTIDADRYAQQAMENVALLDRAGTRGAFWLHAAAVYGALGVHSEGVTTEATLTIGGEMRTLAMDVPFVLPLEGAPHLRVASNEALLTVLTQRSLRMLEADQTLPITAVYEGTLGGATHGRTVLDFAITSNRDEALGPITIEVQIPASFVVDAAAREAMTRVVGSVDGPDLGNVIRLHLPSLAARTSLRIPFALQRVATGTAEGFGVVAYEAAAPDIRFVSPNRAVSDDASLGGAR